MPKQSAGFLMYHHKDGELHVLLAHPGGPIFTKKDFGIWTPPRGEQNEGEDLLQTAKREFEEETGLSVPETSFLPLGKTALKSGKIVHIWAFENKLPENYIMKSNLFKMEWPPRSGKLQEFLEIDKVEFFPISLARQKIHPGLQIFLDRMVTELNRK